MITNPKEELVTQCLHHNLVLSKSLEPSSKDFCQMPTCVSNRKSPKNFRSYIFLLTFGAITYLILLNVQHTVVGSRQDTFDQENNSAMEQLNHLVIFVNEASTARFPNGKSWASAFSSLTDAFESNMYGKEEIWIAKGTYSVHSDADHATRFSLVSDIVLYGGFRGNETSREQRNWKTNATVLSALKSNENDVFRNFYNVVLGSGVLSITMPSTQSSGVPLIPDLVLHIARAQCDIEPLP